MTEYFKGDLVVLAVFLLCLFIILALSELLHSKWSWRSESSRRLVHSLTGLIVVISISYFSSPLFLYIFATLFAILNLVFSKRKIFAGIHDIERQSLGTVTFPLALILGLYLCWTLYPERKGVLQIAFLVMAIADPVASFVGTRFSGNRSNVIFNNKTWAGLAAFVSSAALPLFVFDYPLLGFELSAAHVIVFSLILGMVELISKNGWDNLFIVLAVISLLTLSIDRTSGFETQVLVAMVAATLFMMVSFSLNYLDRSGVVAAGLLGFTLLLVGSWNWVIPALVFFGSSSWLSKLRSDNHENTEKVLAKGSTRDDGQVWANGGVALFIALLSTFYPNPIWFVCLLASFAAAAADTWATEIGMRWGKYPRSILDFRRVERGVSGGVSLLGSLGALLGALVISLCYMFLESTQFRLEYFLLILGSGFVACLLDSFLGATLQAKYLDSTGILTEKKTSNLGANKLVKGFEFVDNDLVNLFSIASASILVLIVHQIL